MTLIPCGTYLQVSVTAHAQDWMHTMVASPTNAPCIAFPLALYLCLDTDANIIVACGALDGGLAPHLQPHARIKLERVATAGDLRVAINNTHLQVVVSREPLCAMMRPILT
jgi:hypothetical protein